MVGFWLEGLAQICHLTCWSSRQSDLTRAVFNWWFQTFKFGLSQCCKVLATLRLSQFIKIQSFKFWFLILWFFVYNYIHQGHSSLSNFKQSISTLVILIIFLKHMSNYIGYLRWCGVGLIRSCYNVYMVISCFIHWFNDFSQCVYFLCFAQVRLEQLPMVH